MYVWKRAYSYVEVQSVTVLACVLKLLLSECDTQPPIGRQKPPIDATPLVDQYTSFLEQLLSLVTLHNCSWPCLDVVFLYQYILLLVPTAAEDLAYACRPDRGYQWQAAEFVSKWTNGSTSMGRHYHTVVYWWLASIAHAQSTATAGSLVPSPPRKHPYPCPMRGRSQIAHPSNSFCFGALSGMDSNGIYDCFTTLDRICHGMQS